MKQAYGFQTTLCDMGRIIPVLADTFIFFGMSYTASVVRSMIPALNQIGWQLRGKPIRRLKRQKLILSRILVQKRLRASVYVEAVW